MQYISFLDMAPTLNYRSPSPGVVTGRSFFLWCPSLVTNVSVHSSCRNRSPLLGAQKQHRQDETWDMRQEKSLTSSLYDLGQEAVEMRWFAKALLMTQNRKHWPNKTIAQTSLLTLYTSIVRTGLKGLSACGLNQYVDFTFYFLCKSSQSNSRMGFATLEEIWE